MHHCCTLLHNVLKYDVMCPNNSVDELLSGGLREGHLTELFGESASGKTQVLST